MPLTNFPNGISSFGIPVMGGGSIPPFTGKYFFVKPYSGSDGNKGDNPSRALKTLSKALSLATANNNDVVFMIAESNTAGSTTDYQSAALNWNKDGVHLIGINNGSFIGQRSRIAQLSTVKTIEDLFTVSADNCLIANIEVYQGVATSTATSPRAVVVTGSCNRFVNCQFSGMGDTSMDTAGARSLAVVYPAHECIFQHCYIGLDTVIRSTNKIEVSVAGTGAGTELARVTFEDCFFNCYVSNTDAKLVAASRIDRFLLFKNCIFSAVQGITSAATPTGAISTANMNGRILILDGGVFGPADVTTADDTNVLLLGHYATTVVDMAVAKATDVSA